MRFDDVVAHLGKAQFETMAQRAVAGASRTGQDNQPGDVELWSVASELVELIFHEAAHEAEALERAAELFAHMPSHAVLAAVAERYDDLSELGRNVLFEHYRRWLQDPTRSRPAAFSLFSDYFEHAGRIDEVWEALVREPAPRALLERLLLIAGPVPYDLKASLYERLRSDASWHPAIYQSLVYSALGERGQIDAPKAKTLLASLEVEEDAEYREELELVLKHA